MGKVSDQGMKDLMRRLVIFRLDDVQGFFLGDSSARPSSGDFEARLDFADAVLRSAEDQFRELQHTIEKYGGPKSLHPRVISPTEFTRHSACLLDETGYPLQPIGCR